MLFSNAARLLTILSTSGIAASVTVGMLIFNRNDKPVTKEVSEILTNIEVQADEFQKEQYFYDENGTNDGQRPKITQEQYEKIQEILKGQKDLVKSTGPSEGDQQSPDAQRSAATTDDNGDNSISIPQLPLQQNKSEDGSEPLDTQETDQSPSNDNLDHANEKKQASSVDTKEGEKQSDLDSEKGPEENDKGDGLALDESKKEPDKEKSELDLKKDHEPQEGRKESNSVDPDQEDKDSLSKTAKAQSEQNDSEGQELTSGAGDSDESSEECKPCPKGNKESKGPEEDKKLDQEGDENSAVKVDSEPKEPNSKEKDAPQEKGEVNSESGPENNLSSDRDGVLDEETSDSSLTNQEQLSVLEGLYGQVTDVLSQLKSRFDI